METLVRSKWSVLLFLLIVESGLFSATWARGDHRKAFEALALVALVALLLLLAYRSDRLRRRFLVSDERYAAILRSALVWSGVVAAAVIWVVFLVEFARGHSGEPYYWLAGIYAGMFIVASAAEGLRR